MLLQFPDEAAEAQRYEEHGRRTAPGHRSQVFHVATKPRSL